MTVEPTFPEDARISATPEQLFSNIHDDVIILDLKSGCYYGLNSVGSFIWQLIQASKTVGEIKAAILAEFDVDEATCSRDLVTILKALAEQGLIEVCYEPTP